MMEVARLDRLTHCKDCDLDLYDEEDYKEHVEKFHAGADPFVCKECHTEWNNKEGLVDHMREHHFYTCTKCDLYFHGRRHYARHERSCGDEENPVDEEMGNNQVEKRMARFVEGMEQKLNIFKEK